MDELDDRLKDLILFINKSSQFDIYAVEIEYYKFEENELMIPKIFGNEVKKDIDVSSGGSSSRNSWNEFSVLQELEESVSKKHADAIKEFYSFAKDKCDILSWGSGKRGAFSIGISKLASKSILTIKTNGVLVLNLGWHRGADDKLDPFVTDLINKLKEIGFTFEEGEIKQHYFFTLDEWFPKLEDLKNLIVDLL